MDSYRILLDMGERSMADFAVDSALSMNFMEGVCVMEGRLGSMPRNHPAQFGLVVMDERAYGAEEAERACRAMCPCWTSAIFIHVGRCPARKSSLRLIGMPSDLFEECFASVLGFCYATHIIRGRIMEARGYPPGLL